jgi:predicted hotdog family 3-hydroxylacyl-ACP dehydratase
VSIIFWYPRSAPFWRDLHGIKTYPPPCGAMAMNDLPHNHLSLLDLLPHRDTMLLVDEVLRVDQRKAEVRCTVRRSWPMAEPCGVHSLILVELAAQSAGVCNGWDRIHTKGPDSDKTGWLVGIKRAEFHLDYLPYGADILCRAENTHNFNNLREVFCEQRWDGRLIGNMILQLYQE